MTTTMTAAELDDLERIATEQDSEWPAFMLRVRACVADVRHLREALNDIVLEDDTEVEQLKKALAALLKFSEELCEDINVSKHYPSMDRARAILKEEK